MRVLLTSHGSTGDIFPLIKLGHTLATRGHDVTFATLLYFKPEVERAGLRFLRVPPDWDRTGLSEAMRDLTKARTALGTLKIIYEECLPYFDEVLDILDNALDQADVFVCSYVFSPMVALAKAKGIPSAVATFAHNVVPSTVFPPDGTPHLNWLPPWLRRAHYRISWHVGDRLVCWLLNRIVGRALAKRGLPAISSYILRPSELSLVTVSPALFGHGVADPERFRFCGYWRWQTHERPEMDPILRGFCAEGPVPVLTFGSVTFEEARKVMHRFIANWPGGKKIIVQSGWAELTIEKPKREELVVGAMSHDQLFQYASVIIHHGGAGTTGSALHAGKPQIIIPHIGDQWFFAREMKRLGVGLQLARSRWPESLPHCVDKVLSRPAMQAKAAEIAGLLRKENGPVNAAELLEQLVQRSGKGESCQQ